MIFIKSIYLNTARSKDEEYTDIRLVFDDCRSQLAEDIAAHAGANAANEPETLASEYCTPYIDLMWRANSKLLLNL